jgi:hypothetical protein
LLLLRGLIVARRRGGAARHFGARRQIARGGRGVVGHRANVPRPVIGHKPAACLPSLPFFGADKPIKSIAAGRRRV